MIVGKNVFDLEQVRLEIEKIFDAEGIGHDEFERFIVATAVLLNGKSVEIVPGFTAEIKLYVGTPRHIKVNHSSNTDESYYAYFLPDGRLKITVITSNNTGDGLASVALDFVDINVDTESYFSRSLVEVDEHNIPRLLLDGSLSFDATKSPPVERTV